MMKKMRSTAGPFGATVTVNDAVLLALPSLTRWNRAYCLPTRIGWKSAKMFRRRQVCGRSG